MDGVFPWLTYDNLIIFGLTVCGIVFVPNLIIAIYDFGIKEKQGTGSDLPFSCRCLSSTRKEDWHVPDGTSVLPWHVIIAIGMVGMELG